MAKIILISGGSDGLGNAIAKKLSTNHQVIILGKDFNKTREVAKELGVDFIVSDVSDYVSLENEIKKLFVKYGHIDCLINNSGKWIEGFVENNSYEEIKKVIDVNTLGTIYLTKAILPKMKEKKSGRIINVISQAGLHTKGERSIYHASKWAITGFTKSLAMEVAGFGVSVCGYYPGAMKTNFFEKVGIKKNMNKHMELDEAVRALEFIVDTPEHITIPELGIKLVNN